MTVPATRALPIHTKLFFSLGWPVEYIVLRSLELFVLFYYTQVLGLPGSLAGLALFIAMLVDAFADPAIGSYSDNLRNSRFGRRHTLMFLAPVPLGLALVAVFMPPADIGQWALFAWLTVSTIAVRFLCGLYIVPYSAQLAELTRDPAERASLQLYKSVAQTLFDSAMLAVAFNLFFAKKPDGSGGQTDPSTYLPFAITLGTALVITTTLSALGTRQRMLKIERETVGDTPAYTGNHLSPARILGAWRKVLFGRANLRALIIGALLTATATSVMRSLASHLGVFFWDLTPEQIGYWQQAAIPGFFVGMIIARVFAKRLELIRMVLVSLILIIGAVTVLPALKLLGVIAPGDLLFKILLSSNFIMGIGSGMLMLLAGLVCAEAADEDEFVTGLAAQGFLFGFVFLATKMGSALGKLLSGTALDVIGFPKGATSIPADVVDTLAWTLVGSVAVLGGVSYYFWSRFHLPKKRHQEILQELQARRDANIPAT
ncbi:MFS transporter [Stenotrophomonas koreensis]|uniref:MFS transporter n=1 Tax=Stenotrophomonas koreensis TaxID=266128 RepID=UPI0009F9EC65|nr:MFS transporter [Stenotrophomonas koreensis]